MNSIKSEKELNCKKYVKVPIEELQKLELARCNLYKYLNNHLDASQMSALPLLTSQIWKVANMRTWKDYELK